MHDVILVNMNTWKAWKTGTTNRNREVFEELEHRPDINRILLVDFFPHTSKRAARYALDEFPYYNKRLEHLSDIDRGLYKISDKLFLYTTTLTVFGAVGQLEAYRHINGIRRKLGFEHTILWSYNPLFTHYFLDVEAEYKVFDCVDNWSKHPAHKRFKKRLGKNYKKIERRADAIFTVSSELLKLFPDHTNVSFIPNGVRPFDHVPKKQKKDKSVINVGYVGVIQDRVNTLVLDAILREKDMNITMIGPVWKDFSLTPYKDNKQITFTNATVPHREIPQAIRDMDVMIIPHKINEFTKSMNPMKLYDYLACGKPVVSTPLQDLNDLTRFVEIAKKPDQFPKLIRKAASEDSMERTKMRIDALKKHSWELIVNSMLKQIDAKKIQREPHAS